MYFLYHSIQINNKFVKNLKKRLEWLNTLIIILKKISFVDNARIVCDYVPGGLVCERSTA